MVPSARRTVGRESWIYAEVAYFPALRLLQAIRLTMFLGDVPQYSVLLQAGCSGPWRKPLPPSPPVVPRGRRPFQRITSRGGRVHWGSQARQPS